MGDTPRIPGASTIVCVLNQNCRPAWTSTTSWRLAESFAFVVLSGHAVLALIGMLDGRSVFNRGVDPDSMFADHWLASFGDFETNSVTLWITLMTLCMMVAMRCGVAGPWRPALVGLGWTVAAFFSLILPANLSLYVVPFLLPLAFFRAGWPEFSIILFAATGVTVGFATLRYRRSTGPGCPACGRSSVAATPSQALVRLATVAAYAATLAPMGYAVVRLMWAAGIPVGTTEGFLRQINDANPGNGTVIMEIALAGMAMGGAVLCWGLTRPWSRVWPRWVPALRGRAVPRWFPVGMGLVGGAGLSGYATMLIPGVLSFVSGEMSTFPGTGVQMTWLSHLPGISLIVWAPLLVIASVLFGYATRPECVCCGPS